MSGKTFKLIFSLSMILALGVAPSFAASAVIGSVAGGTNATIGGQALMPNTTLFSGDSLQVKDGAAVVAMGMGSRMVFGRETLASFEKGTDDVTVTLAQGNVSMYHPVNGTAMRVKIGDVSVLVEKGYKTLGEVAMVNGAVVVTAKEGVLRVQGPDRTMELTKGKTIEIAPKAAGSPAPGQTAGAAGAGSAASHVSTFEVLTIASVGAGGAATATGVVSIKKADDAKTAADASTAAANAAAAAANAATAASNAATAAANAAAAEAKAACLKAASPSTSGC
ncbi:MAG TPA: hypothetical protein VKV95_09985 [Terriglobia bacterium]|nr:hypothetical protein [Terriglobia bacterium]